MRLDFPPKKRSGGGCKKRVKEGRGRDGAERGERRKKAKGRPEIVPKKNKLTKMVPPSKKKAKTKSVKSHPGGKEGSEGGEGGGFKKKKREREKEFREPDLVGDKESHAR